MTDEDRVILEAASDLQRRYVIARVLGAGSTAKACKKIGIHRTTPAHWDNLDDLEKVVTGVLIDQIDGARWALTQLTVPAIKALSEALEDRPYRVGAANSILDRTGLPRQSDVTSGGEPIKAVVYIPDNDRDDRD